jgi:arsenite-transporting ATPase
VADALREDGVSDIQADELAVIPGMEEIAALIQIERKSRSGEFDCIVVDAAPTGETVRLLSMPESFQWYAGRIQQWRGRLLRIAGPFLGNMLPDLNIVEGMSRLAERVRGLRTTLTDARLSSYRIVLTPDRTVLKEAQRAETYLNLFEYPIDAVVINCVLAPSTAGDPYLDALVMRQQRTMADIHDAFISLPSFEALLTPEEPVGVAALRSLAQQVFGDRDPTQVLHIGPTQRIDREGADYVLRIPMPNVEVSKLDLTKRGDELYVDLGNYRRDISLPLTLAALEPGIARVREGMLEIPFHPQPSAAAAS